MNVQMLRQLTKHMNNHSIVTHLLTAFVVRVLLIIFSEIQDKVLTLKYTDIDYQIFTDGARYVSKGESPYLRDTYRYTPLLAYLVLPNVTVFGQFGKILFSTFDVLSGLLVYVICGQYLDKRRAKLCAIIWLYNPLPAIVSTRGSAESVVTTLVLLTIACLAKRQLVFGGLVYGFVIHFKLYPVVYIPALYLYLTKSTRIWKAFKPNVKKVKFFGFASIGFVLPTYWSYVRYGQIYLDEAWLYHLHRKDPQHNFSVFFYVYHLVKSEENQKLFAYLAFIPQIVSIVSLAFYYCLGSEHKTQDLIFGLFAQTMVFVTLNKVITSQYFLWYLCLLPLVWPYIRLTNNQWLIVLIVWLLSQAQWLLPAYLYEFQHWDCLLWVWISSWTFLVINISILVTILLHYNCLDKKKRYKKD